MLNIISTLANIFTAIATLFTAFAAVAAVFVAWFEYRKAEKARFEDIRPWVIPDIRQEVRGKDQHVILTLRNVGNTVATHVFLDFESESQWNWVSNPDYPFLREFGGIRALPPGEKQEFFLGMIRKGNPMENLLNEFVKVVISVNDPRGGKPLKDEYKLSLKQNKYKTKN